ncbi:MAG: MBL fold metallo-hydrolase [Vicinamibacterales bacterium]
MRPIGTRRAALLAAAVVVMLWTGTARPGAQGRVETLLVQGQVHLLAGAGGNVTALVGPQGVMLVDAGSQGATESLLAALRTITPLPIHFLINTSADPDHVGGNAAISQSGRPMPGWNGAGVPGAPIFAHENVQRRMSAPGPGDPGFEAPFWPTSTFFTAKHTLHFNDEPIELLWQQAAHSDADLMIFFRRSDVISAGDIVNMESFPVIDLARGGSIQGEIDALNRIIDIAIPRMNQMDGTRIIPGHGRLCNEADVVEYRDMVTVIRDRVQTLLAQGKTLEEVQASRPAYEYEPVYGADQGPWTTRMFVEAVYRSLEGEDARSRAAR